MNRRIDPGSAVTAFVLVAMLLVAVALSPKAKPAPPTPIEVLDSALQAALGPRVAANVLQHNRLSITVFHDSAGWDAERIARLANANYHGEPIDAISVYIVRPNGMDYGGTFLPVLLDGRVTPVAIDPTTFPARTAEDSVHGAFAASELETILRALPLTTGYAARLPMYWPNAPREGVQWESIYVVGADSTCRCWRVNAAGLIPAFRQLQIPLKP